MQPFRGRRVWENRLRFRSGAVQTWESPLAINLFERRLRGSGVGRAPSQSAAVGIRWVDKWNLSVYVRGSFMIGP